MFRPNKKFLSLFLGLIFTVSSAFTQEQLYETSVKYTDKNGQYLQSRKGLHKNILNKYLTQIVRQAQKKNPIAIFMAGGPGAGKSYSLSLLSNAGLINLNNYVIINSDDIKEMIPEYQAFKKYDTIKAADMVHKESSYLKDLAVNEARRRKVNFILDGTFSKIPESKALMQSLPDFKTKIIFVDAPTEVLLKRVLERGGRTGRFVPADFVKKASEEIRKSIAELSKMAEVTFFIWSSEKSAIKEIRFKNGRILRVDTPIDLLSKKQVNDFKKLLD